MVTTTAMIGGYGLFATVLHGVHMRQWTERLFAWFGMVEAKAHWE